MSPEIPAPAAPVAALDSAATGRLAGLTAALRPLGIFAAITLAILTVSRLGLLGTYWPRVADEGLLRHLLALGLRFDLVVVAALVAPVVLLQILLPAGLLATRAWDVVRAAWLTAWIAVITFNEAATPDFIAEFGVRPNRQYIEYLNTPGVVFDTIWQSHRASLLVGTGATALVAWATRRWLARGRSAAPGAWLRLLVLLPLLVGLGYTARGSLGHRPLSASNAAVTADATVNDLALNSTYSVAYAARQLFHEQEGLRGYGHLPEAEALARVQSLMQVPAAGFLEPGRTTAHWLVPTAAPARPPNLVILLQESLGAQYFASLGGAPVAQKLETWRDRSFWFDRLYASGTRSARGIEAVVTGFQPTRTNSVIKLDGAQQDFFTLARVLKAQGYRTEFIYGGDASFDNMRRFFLNNGFDRVIDQADLLPKAAFATTWGVSDEDLYARLHEEVTRHYRDGKPFFTLVFSTSNHPPYDFPDGRVDLFEQPKMSHRNAARYADYAVGSYLDLASRAAYWANTLFTVVADHESRSTGKELVPVFSFHIPAFIAGGPVKPRVVDRLASQIDLLPTTLSLMGLKVVVPATGMDQSRDDLAGPGHASMQFNDNFAWRVGDRVAILVPHQPIREYRVAGRTLEPVPTDPEFAKDALAETQVPVQAYRDRWYH